MRVRLAVIDAMIAHARADAPLECCGLLIGGEETIEACRPAVNLRSSPVAYQIDPRDHFDAIREARSAGRAVVGAYHSHPASAPVPSATDIAEAFDSDILYVILSLRPPTPEIRAYRIRDGHFREIRLVPEP